MSKLALGTAQFGLDYGMCNIAGQIPIEEARKILNLAKEHHIDTLDTASSYGDSEKILGHIGVSDFHLVTKTASLQLNQKSVLKTFYKSLKSLNVNSVEGLLIHNIDDTKNKQFESLYKELDKLKQDKIINKIGFSTYTPDQVDYLLKNFDFDLIQVPFNVFDVRLLDGFQLQALKRKDVEIHARSIFLQGLLLNFEHLSGYFSSWKNEFDEYQKIIKEKNSSLLEYALNFVLNTEEIDKVLVGVDSEKQFKEIIDSVKEHNLISSFPINDKKLLNPSLWKL